MFRTADEFEHFAEVGKMFCNIAITGFTGFLYLKNINSNGSYYPFKEHLFAFILQENQPFVQRFLPGFS